MKVACIGNMNNMMYPTARYLADAGHEVTLFLLDEYEHFLPDADSFDQVPEVNIVSLGWNDLNFYAVTSKAVKAVFQPFDFFIGTDYAPAILLKAYLSVDIYFPAGGDLFDYPFRKLRRWKWLPAIFQIEAWRCAKYQKMGLSLVKTVSMDAANEDFERYLPLLNMDKKKRIPALPFLYMDQYTPSFFAKSAYLKKIEKLKAENDFLVVQHCRQSWKCDKSDLHYKGNELLLEGFHDFIASYPESKIKLLLLEYGLDVEASRELIALLRMEGHVVWLPKMHRKDLMAVIRQCDVGVGELGRSWFSYGVVFELLAMKVPFIGNRKDSDYSSKMTSLYPMYHAASREEVRQQLDAIYRSRFLSSTVEEAYSWFMENAINKSVRSVLELLKKPLPAIRLGTTSRLKKLSIDALTTSVVLLNKILLKFSKFARIHYGL